jgi:hypothetical protein
MCMEFTNYFDGRKHICSVILFRIVHNVLNDHTLSLTLNAITKSALNACFLSHRFDVFKWQGRTAN